MLQGKFVERNITLQIKQQRKKHVWNSIADEIKRHSYDVTGDQCKGRWNTLLTAFRRCLHYNNVTGLPDIHSAVLL